MTDASDPALALGWNYEVRACPERLAVPLSPEDQWVPAMPDVSPAIGVMPGVTWSFEAFLGGRVRLRALPRQVVQRGGAEDAQGIGLVGSGGASSLGPWAHARLGPALRPLNW
jgi:hypothetical protein